MNKKLKTFIILSMIAVIGLCGCQYNASIPTASAETNDNNVSIGINEALKNEHIHDYGNSVHNATCTTKGYTLSICFCGDIEISNETDKLGHDYSVITEPATCEKDGFSTYTCARCNHTYTDVILTTGHNLESKIINPTCTEDGYTIHTCLVEGCGYTYNDAETNALGHDYKSTINKASTCENKGIKTHNCSRCNHSYTEDIKALGHSYKSTVVEPTYEDKGYTQYTCSTCGNSYKDNWTAKKETVLEEMERRGNIGRLTIPSVGVNVALFNASVYDVGHSQGVVDRSDSAAYLYDSVDHYGFIMIADHVHQGFNAIKWATPGSTTLYIDFGTYTESYICTEIFIGYNGYDGRTGMFDAYGNDVAGRNDGGLCLYTCNSDGTITITFWQPA